MNKTFSLTIMLTVASVLPFGVILSSLNHISEDFGVTYDYVYYSIVLYLFVSAFVNLFFGTLVDYFGKKRMLLVAFSVFIFSALVCAVATNIYLYLIFRVLQASIVGVFTVAMILVKDNYHQSELTVKLNNLSLAYAIAPIVATVLGGVIDDVWGWRAIFWLLAIVYTVAIVAVIKGVDNDNVDKASTINSHWQEYTKIFKIASFWGYTTINALCMGVFFIFIAAVPAVLTNYYAISSVNTGLIMSLPPFGFVLSCLFSEKLFQSYSWNEKIFFGRLVVFLGLIIALFAYLIAERSVANIMIGGFLIGVGNGISTPNIKSAMVSIQNHMLGSMIGLFSFFSSLLGAVISAGYSFFAIDYQHITVLYWVLLIPAFLGLLASCLMWFAEKKLGETP